MDTTLFDKEILANPDMVRQLEQELKEIERESAELREDVKPARFVDISGRNSS
ncbi:hypothetical protein PAENIP36_70520 [Paenibacillus sp. P36]